MTGLIIALAQILILLLGLWFVALEQVLAAMNCDHKDARRYFELIVNEQTNGGVE